MLKLKEIKARANIQKLEMADVTLSILQRMSKFNAETSIEELEETQNHLRAILNKAEKEIKVIEQDREFVKELMDKHDIKK